jgi:hypothetical protein
MSPEPFPSPGCPAVADVETITAIIDPVARNLHITQAYHELSAALATLTGPAADWCTFATWASRQAGQTIRGEDLIRKIESELGGPEAIDARLLEDVASRLREVLRALGRPLDELDIARAIRDLFSPTRLIERCSDAVARGNRKVFEEIGRAFARFIPLALAARGRADALAEAADRVSRDLRPGDPPDGQRLLQAAFRDYQRALSASEPKSRAELMLLANLRIGQHEQTRLQPEIAEALNVAIPDPGALRHAVLERLVPQPGFLIGLRARIEASLGARSRIDEALARLAEHLRRRVRLLITEEMMTLALPGGPIRLGADVTGRFPPDLERIANPELADLLRSVDPTPDSLQGSGARDWANLTDRMHFITDLFRTRQEDVSLFDPPFTAPQLALLKQGQLPPGPL